MTPPKTAPIWLSETDVRSLVQNARKAKASIVSLIAGLDKQVETRRTSWSRTCAT